MESSKFYTNASDIYDTDDCLQSVYASFAATQTRRLHIDQLQKPPSRWDTMLSHPESSGFINAATIEFQSQENKGTWEEVQKPTNVKVLPLKWVFTY